MAGARKIQDDSGHLAVPENKSSRNDGDMLKKNHRNKLIRSPTGQNGTV